jgi:predicted ATP-dependent endonuclease of OLD family
VRLKSFRVRVFRNIIDSGEIEVTDNTCLVGKNEAGKSALIGALHRLNPAKPIALELLDEYPRWLKKEHEISGAIKDAVPITATFELEADELRSLEESYGKGVLKSPHIVAKRKYSGDMEIELPINFATFIQNFVTNHVTEVLKPRLNSPPNSSELINQLDVISKETSADGEPTPEAQAAKQARGELSKILKGPGSLTAALTKELTPLVPKTFFFSQYSQLRGRYNLTEVLPALSAPSEDEEIQAAADFLKLARISPTNLETWDFEASNAELEAISSLLTKRVKANWKQNQHLKLRVNIESVPVAQRQPDRFLQFRVEDTRHDFSSRLDRRSTGFQWFVSFIASFFEFEKETKIILLLDEPGLSLHARAQMDLLDAIDEHLTKGRQVLYTTHSPFMVRVDALQRVRIVEDQGPEKGTIVLNEAGVTSDPDTLFPLQAALGYDIAQNLFIGNRNILMEGVSDLIYLSVLSSHLNSLGRASLPETARLLPAGGATDISTFIALLGGKLKVVVLLDGDAQRQRIDKAIAQGRLESQHVLSIDQFCSVKGADIEDLFEPSEYLELYNATFKKTHKLKDLKGTDRIIKRLERLEGAEFNHGRVAGYFISHQAEVIPTLSKETLDRFESLISALNKALPQ